MSTRFSAPASAADDAAALWLMAHDRGMSREEQARFEAWRDASALHAAAWRRAERVMQAYPGMEDHRLADLREAALSLRPPAWKRWPNIAMAVAACAVAAVGITQAPRLLRTAPTLVQQQAAAAPSRFLAQSKAIKVALEDGSDVQLDAHADLDVHLQPGRRDLTLRHGRAYFRVAHDAHRPFVVTAQGMTITATGTAFAVTTQGDGLSVVLETGHVRIASVKQAGPPIELVPGQEYRLEDGRAQVRGVQVATALAWRDGVIDLKDTPVSQALQALNLYSATPIVADPGAGRLKVTGRFPYDDAPAFAEAVASIYPVHVERLRDGRQRLVANRP